MLSATQLVYRAAGFSFKKREEGACCCCGGALYDAVDVWEVARDTFMDWDALRGSGERLCAGCAYCWREHNDEITARLGRDKRQRTRNYSHFVVNDEWLFFSKAQKRAMAQLLARCVPQVAVVAVSGQKHLLIKARANESCAPSGWVMFEEQHVYLSSERLARTLGAIERLYALGATKAEIADASYRARPGLPARAVLAQERALRGERGGAHFDIALFLASKEDEEELGDE